MTRKKYWYIKARSVRLKIHERLDETNGAIEKETIEHLNDKEDKGKLNSQNIWRLIGEKEAYEEVIRLFLNANIYHYH